jgi:tetratricopeptide (TPR) repeat protein
MTIARTYSWTKPAIRVAAAGLGGAVAGPLGAALGSWFGGAIGGSAAELVEKYVEKFGEHSGEKLFEIATDSLTERLKEPSLPLESVYREALRLSLADIHAQVGWDGFDDWFANWERCLRDSNSLHLSSIALDQLVPERLDSLFRLTMERLDAQGTAIQQKKLSLILQPRIIPDALLAELIARLPERLQENLRTLAVQPENDLAWKQTQLLFQDFAHATLERIEKDVKPIPQIAEDTAVIRKIIEDQLNRALQEGRLAKESEQTARAQVATLTVELQKLREQVTERKTEPGGVALSDLLKSGDLDGALRVKIDQVEARRHEVGKLAQDLFELGTLHELRFNWPKALEAYRDAWRLKRETEYGLKYAYLAQRQKQFNEAEEAYGTLLTLYRERAKANANPHLANLATTLNNLGSLYRDTLRTKEAEEAYLEALSIRGALAEVNPSLFVPAAAITLNNLANLYRDTQRMKEAEEHLQLSLSVLRRYANANSEAYLPDVAMALHNLGFLYRKTQRTKEAEEAYQEALSIRRELAKASPQAYVPEVAKTLNNLGNLYVDTQRMKEAEEAYQEALSIRRELAEDNPEAYVPEVAETLNNLANLYRNTQRVKEAEVRCLEAEKHLQPFWEAHPQAHGNQMARILLLRALLCAGKDACAFAQRAFAAARDPDIKHVTQALIDQFCADIH